MFENAEERVRSLKTGLSEKEIERLYIEYNNFKIIRKPFIHKAKEFEFARSFFDSNGKTISKPVLGSVVLILSMFFPISTLFIALVLVLFLPPILAMAMILNEGISIISNDLKTVNF